MGGVQPQGDGLGDVAGGDVGGCFDAVYQYAQDAAAATQEEGEVEVVEAVGEQVVEAVA